MANIKSIYICASLFISTSALAECFRLNRNSCWDINNRGLSDIEISCRDDHADLFGVRLIYSGGTMEHQFPDRLNNGRGSFGPDFLIRCKIKFKNNTVLPIKFFMLDSGDRVEIRIDERAVNVMVRSYWTRGFGRNYSFKRN